LTTSFPKCKIITIIIISNKNNTVFVHSSYRNSKWHAYFRAVSRALPTTRACIIQPYNTSVLYISYCTTYCSIILLLLLLCVYSMCGIIKPWFICGMLLNYCQTFNTICLMYNIVLNRFNSYLQYNQFLSYTTTCRT